MAKLGQLPQAVKAYRSWLRLAPADHPERRRMRWRCRRPSAGRSEPTRGEVFRDCDGTWCPEMVVVPAGSFVMGSPAGETDRNSNEDPRHRVTMANRFAVGVYEVTFEEWDACRRGGGCSGNPGDEGWGRGRRPVINVSWTDAQAYVKWLSSETREAYRLLSESEWEYIARAGTTGPFHFGATISDVAQDVELTTWELRILCLACKGRYRRRTAARGLVSSQCVWCARCAWKRVGVGGGLPARQLSGSTGTMDAPGRLEGIAVVGCCGAARGSSFRGIMRSAYRFSFPAGYG